MHGRIIAGITDPEITRLESELARMPGGSSSLARNPAARDLARIIETRKRIAAKREQLFTEAPEPSDALDVLNARAEAADLAQRMNAAGYTPTQIRAAVAPILVDPASTITGRKERREARKKRKEERKAAGKGVFRKIGNAVKKAGSFVYKGAAKLNPILAGARVATLSLVRKNAGGIADNMRKAGAQKMRKKWEALGGDFSKLQKAVERGAGQRITGLAGADASDQDYGAEEEQLEKKADASGLDKLWELAKPVIVTILGPLGVSLDKTGKVQVAEGANIDRTFRNALEKAARKLESAATKAVGGQVEDAIDPNTGGGAGNNGGASISGGVMLGVLALLTFVAIKR